MQLRMKGISLAISQLATYYSIMLEANHNEHNQAGISHTINI